MPRPDAMLQMWKVRAERAEAQADALLAQVQSLTVALMQSRTAETPTAPLARKPADPVSLAISEVAGTDARLRGHLSKWAQAERRKHPPTADDVLVDRIFHWDSSDDEAPLIDVLHREPVAVA